MSKHDYDFCGWATKYNLLCSDGRTIKSNAFMDCDGKTVPLVWSHSHGDPTNVLGHALLECRPEGVFTYGWFNDTEKGQIGKELVRHRDVTSLSIYANQLKQNNKDVVHGVIREVSLVLAGANPGAMIETWLTHADGTDDEIVVYCEAEEADLNHSDEEINSIEEPEISHDDEGSDGAEILADALVSALGGALEMSDKTDKSFQDVFDEFTDEQKEVVYTLIGMAWNKNSKSNEGDNEKMKHNVFDNCENDTDVLSHSDVAAIFDDIRRYGSLKDSVLAHGIEDIEYLFPDDTAMGGAPTFIKREDAWVSDVMNGVHHTPFARTKSMYANLTEPDARAKGYIKGHQKAEEVFSVLKRTTSPTTVYKKQKLDRDDLVDIRDFDTVSWLKTEMRMMLDEEIARAILVGDGRSSASDDKINEQCIRPIWTDDPLFTINKTVTLSASATSDERAKAVIRTIIRSYKDYKGSGNPTMYTTEAFLADCLLMEDSIGHVLYDSVDKLATALRVKKIVTVPVMEDLSRISGNDTKYLKAIIVNPVDYNVGADKGGSVSMFEDFDIDYNQEKYLIETRCSGSLVRPYSAIAVEVVVGNSLTVAPDPGSTTRYGKSVSDLQSGIIVHDDYIEGTLKYVTGYTGYSGDVTKQSGNYLALNFDAPEGATTKIQLLGGSSGEKDMTDDMYVVIRVANKNTQKLKVTSTLDGNTVTKIYSLSALRIEEA